MYSLQTPIIGLIASKAPLVFSPDYFDKRLRDQALLTKLRLYRLQSPYSLFGCFIAGPKDLAKFAGEGPLNTDDRPIVIFQAPRFAYNETEPPYVRLLTLVDQLKPLPQQILKLAGSLNGSTIGERFAAYWSARDHFLHAGVGIRQTTNIGEMLAQVQEPLLSIIRESPDFEAAYNPLITMAQHLYSIDPKGAENLLTELEVANPQRSEARQLREYFRKLTINQ